MSRYIKWFDEIRRKDIPIAGGKGANLGEMTAAGFPIPPGFIVTSNAYFDFLKYNNLEQAIIGVLKDLDVNDSNHLDAVSKKIEDMIKEGEIPKEMLDEIVEAYTRMGSLEHDSTLAVAVRSSATAEDLPEASFAGQQKTFLNMKGTDEVVKAVRECWASLFEPRAIFYRVQNGFEHMKVGLAAVVQKLVFADRAGVMFSVDPVTMDRDILVIEGAFGLGEAVVSGMVTPDTYKIKKSTMQIVSKDIAEQSFMIVRDSNGGTRQENIDDFVKKNQKLTDQEIRELAKIGTFIEKHYTDPQDMEWAIEGNRMFIVQSRNITTLNPKQHAEIKPDYTAKVKIDDSMKKDDKQEEKKEEKKETKAMNVLVKGLAASPGIVYGKVKILKGPEEIFKMKQGDILVTSMTSPDYVPAMKKAAGIVTDEGGITSHAAIVSRELGIPCIVGTSNATKVLKEGEEITVDGRSGLVYEGNVIGGTTEHKEEHAQPVIMMSENIPATATKIYVNMAQPDLADKIAKMPVDGVGLMRAEFIVANMGKHPKEFIAEGKQEEFINTLAEEIRKVAAAFFPRPIVYRATDFKTNEYRHLQGGEKYEGEEENPMIGFRGASRYIKEPEVFKMELEALKKVMNEYNLRNVRLMIPFVRRVGELRAIKDIMHSAGLYRTKDFKVWIMVEVPSTVFLLDKFIDVGIDGVSIGSNDLTQLILGIDRDNTILGRDFDERNEAVMEAIKMVVKTCNRRGITASICGQAPSVYPELTERLIEFGITSVSVNPDAFERTKKIVASAEKRVMLKMLREQREKDEDS
ncbi:MAG: phosphoenolpyruvate synthase [Candidatus Micrarchaeota archaeon]|nr:phosphoenolpyruvate synthase [Candidatus Micrarchaeota archaeon]